MRLILLLMTALVLAGPAAAKPTLAEPEIESVTPPAATEEIAAAFEQYGEWLVRLNDAQAPAQSELGALAGEWQAAIAAGRDGPVRFRAVVARTLAAIDRSTRLVEALDEPDFPVLELPEDLVAARMKQDMLRLNRELRVVIESFDPMLDAIVRNDEAAALAAAGRMLESLQLVLDTQILFARAALVTTPREEGNWEAQNIQLLTFRVGSRMLTAWTRELDGVGDPGLGRDLAELATELETTSRRGQEKFDEEIVYYADLLAAAEAEDDAARADIVQRVLDVARIDRAYFPLGARLAAAIRRGAGSFDRRPSQSPGMSALLGEWRLIRVELEDIARAESEALAGAD